ncbi:hypothetical protein P4O66_001153 [Electrophorus voltai]|uniref:Gypsy retrotransposon integrase-like protein 1 n=1 Tax=Electrophorus voltai TaxID=2609070 RepID=A0AAD9DUC0_9TELE|nr:hypothetical protein P4O66_001153 [Electrophorus voltai]
MGQYIKEALQRGYVQPSTSPASAGVFFIKKRDWGLRPRVDYRGLNKLLVPYLYTLPLVPAVLEQLRGASLAIAPSIFQAYINEVLREFLGRSIIAYIDDILIYSPSWNQHVHDMRAIIQTLLQNRLYCKAKKCEFHHKGVDFLGYAIQEGHRFIKSFSLLARPLTDHLRGPVRKIKWTQEAETAFEELKNAVTTAPVLQQPDLERPFMVEVDASNVGAGAVLSQHMGERGGLRPIAYFSRKLSLAERNYGVGDQELLAMKLAFEEWRYWLEGARHPFTMYTDVLVYHVYKNLEYLQTTKRLNGRQARWSTIFSRFQFRVTDRPGEKNTRGDTLPWQHKAEARATSLEPVLSPTCFLASLEWELNRQIKVANPHPQCPANPLYVPPTHRGTLITWAHTSLGMGHPGATSTAQLIGARYWWPAMPKDVVRSHQPWSHLAVDFVTDLPVSEGNTSILSVVDRFSKMVRFIPLVALPTTLETADLLFCQVFRQFSLLKDIISEREITNLSSAHLKDIATFDMVYLM